MVHAGHRHAVIVVKEARAQVHELKIYVCQLLLVPNYGCSIYGIDSEQNTVEHNMQIMYNVIFIGHVYFLSIIVICKELIVDYIKVSVHETIWEH